MEDINQQCPFVEFSRGLLENTELAKPIYHLQHDSGFNINLIFYLLWFAKACFGRLTKRNVKILQSQIVLWHQRVIAELKYTYALVAEQTDSIALQIKQALQEEILRAYVIEQHMLYESRLKTNLLRRSLPQQLMDACVSMTHYCELKNDLLIEDDQNAFIKLSSVVFNTVPQSDIEKQVLLAFSRFKSDRSSQLMWSEL